MPFKECYNVENKPLHFQSLGDFIVESQDNSYSEGNGIGATSGTATIPREYYFNPNRPSDRRKKSDGERKVFVVAEMQAQHHEIARRLLLGQKNVEIAEALNCCAATISHVKNSPIVKDKLTLMNAARDAGAIDLAQEIMNLGPVAIKKVQEALETGVVMGQQLNGSEILRQANTVIDRIQGKPTQTVNTRNLHAHLSLEDIEQIKERARALAPGGPV
jgi:hypothetical protein